MYIRRWEIFWQRQTTRCLCVCLCLHIKSFCRNVKRINHIPIYFHLHSFYPDYNMRLVYGSCTYLCVCEWIWAMRLATASPKTVSFISNEHCSMFAAYSIYSCISLHNLCSHLLRPFLSRFSIPLYRHIFQPRYLLNWLLSLSSLLSFAFFFSLMCHVVSATWFLCVFSCCCCNTNWAHSFFPSSKFNGTP